MMAVHESPLRMLEPAEVDDRSLPKAADGQRCPISKSDGRPSLAEVGQWFYLCHADTLGCLTKPSSPRRRASVRARVSPLALPPPDWTQGRKTVWVLRLNFPDDTAESISEAAAADLMREVSEFFVKTSYGTLLLETTVTPLLTLPKPRSSYVVTGESQSILNALLDDARAAAEAAGFAESDFDLDCAHVKRGVISSSRGNVGRKGVWLHDNDPWIACHEFGHNLGLAHANAWRTTDGSVIGSGKNQEYGNMFDTMGNGPSYHFNACHKHRLKWLSDAAVQLIRSDGVYRLYPFDVPTLEKDLTYALRISKDSKRDYWIETRQALGSAAPFSGSLLLNWSPWSESASGSQLLDTTPGSEGGQYDAPLELGRSFYDPALGRKIIPWSLGGTTPESIDVMVRHVHYVTVEAESGILAQSMTVVEDPLASNGEGIASPMAGPGGAVFTLEIPAEGEYGIWCRILASQPGPISLSVSVDGESEELNAVLEPAATASWHWIRIAERSIYYSSPPPPKLFPLTAGSHTVHFNGANENFQIDCLLFTDDPTTSTPPIIAKISDQITMSGMAVSIPFTLTDIDSPPPALRLSARSSNPSLVPNGNIEFGGNTINRTLTITPGSNQVGTASITLTAVDSEGASTSGTFSLTVIGAVQALINAASPGDTVTLPGGTFIEGVVIDKDLTLQGAGTAATVIDGSKVNVALTITNSATVIVRNVTLRNSRCGLLNYGTATLSECAIRDNRNWGNGGGILNGSTGSLLLQQCTVSGNHSSGMGGGIYNAVSSWLSTPPSVATAPQPKATIKVVVASTTQTL
jgi:hypothetical protein